LKDLEQQEASGTFDLLTKKEAAPKRINKITPSLRWYKTMGGLPDVAIIIDQKREMTARMSEIRNSNCFILDTNCDPDLVDVPIPGNDDAVRSIKLILKVLTDSIITGKSQSN
jgi:small subunit ribosomal protein S2